MKRYDLGTMRRRFGTMWGAAGLVVDLQQLMMAYGYFKTGAARQDACFVLRFPGQPRRDAAVVACGLELALDRLEAFQFGLEDLDFLATLRGADGQVLFDDHFLDYLRQLELEVEVCAVPEGTVVFPTEPVLRVTGPILQAQLLETTLLGNLGPQSSVATQVARIVAEAAGASVLECGSGRAAGAPGTIEISRAAYVGGAAGTTNVLAGRWLGIPVRGTHTHGWVLSFDDEEEAFVAYAAALPGNCVFLVDTFDSLAGVRRATAVGRELRRRGYDLLGVELGAKELKNVGAEVRRMLDAGGLTNARIVANGTHDAQVVGDLIRQGARIDEWVVGPHGASGWLDTTYDLTAIRAPGGGWEPRATPSSRLGRSSDPGILQVRRFRDAGRVVADAIFDALSPPSPPVTIVDSQGERRRLAPSLEHEDLLVPVFRAGRRLCDPLPLDDVRRRTAEQLREVGFLALAGSPGQHDSVGLEESLHDIKSHLLREHAL